VLNDSDAFKNEKVQEFEKVISELKEKIYFLEQEKQDLFLEKEKFQIIADFSNDWDFWINTRGEFIWISPSCYDLTGFSPEEFLNEPDLLFSLIFPEDENRFRLFFESVMNFSQIGRSIEFRILSRTKQLRWCELKTKAIFDKMGSYLGQRGSIRDITRLMTALGEITQISGQHFLDVKTREKYRTEIAEKDRELVSSLIKIAQKNEMVLYLRKNLSIIKNELPLSQQKKIAEMLIKIDDHQRGQTFNWDDFTLHFEKVHPGFFVRLKAKFPFLTTKDHRISAYIRLGLSTKEIANLLNITPESAEITRIRLRKKLGLEKKINLTSFLQEI
jgi:PAS domain S-box-containing protein